MLFKKLIFAISLFVSFSASTAFAQVRVDEVVSPASVKTNRSRGLNMLDEIKSVIKQRYYDKNFHGINLERDGSKPPPETR